MVKSSASGKENPLADVSPGKNLANYRSTRMRLRQMTSFQELLNWYRTAGKANKMETNTMQHGNVNKVQSFYACLALKYNLSDEDLEPYIEELDGHPMRYEKAFLHCRQSYWGRM
jgi:hypothetical protein